MSRKTLVVLAALGGLLALAAQGSAAWTLARTEALAAGGAIASQDGRFTGKVVWGSDPLSPEMERFALIGPEGQEVWSRAGFGENACMIANDGLTVVGMRGPGIEGLPATLTFYGPKGEKGAEVVVKGPSGTAFSQDGSAFFVRSQDLGIGAFDRSGKKLWKVPGGRLFASDPSGKRLAVEDQGTLFLYEEGRLAGKMDLGAPFAVGLVFSPEGSCLVVVTSRRLRMVQIADLKLAWSTELKEAGRSFTSASLSRDGVTAVGVDYDAGPGAAPEERYPKGDVWVFGPDGKRAWAQEIPLGGFSPHRPLVTLSPDGMTLRAEGADRVFLYERKGGPDR